MTAMRPTAKPLLRRGTFRAGESLPSLLERLRVVNGYVARKSLYDLCRDQLPRRASDDTPDAPVHPETYTVLSSMLGIAAIDVYEATIHRFAPCLRMPDTAPQTIPLSSGETVEVMIQTRRLHHVRSGVRVAFCRACLAEDSYQRLNWLPHLTTVCSHHGCLLEERCSHCGKFQNVAGIVANQCIACHEPLSDGPRTDLSGDRESLEAAAVFAEWLDRGVDAAIRLGVPDRPPNVLYRILDGLRQCLSSRARDLDEDYWQLPAAWPRTVRSVESTPSIAETHILYTTALKVMRDWPNGFYEFLDAYDARAEGTLGTTLNDGFGTLYTVWLSVNWASDKFDFVRAAFDEHLASGRVLVPSAVKSNRHRAPLLEKWEYLSVKDAMQWLGIGQDTFEVLLKAGTLHEMFPRDHRPFRYRLVSRQEVYDLKREWTDGFTLSQACTELGLSEVSVAELADSGRLEVLRKPQEGSAGWLFTKESVQRYRGDIMTRVQLLSTNTDDDTRLITLKRASQILGPVGGNALTVLERVITGKLNAFVSVSDQMAPGNLVFEETDIIDAAAQIKAENGWYDAADIAALLHLKRTVIDKWIAHGLLVSAVRSGLAVYFDRDAVSRFVEEHVFVEEAARIMEIGTATTQRWIRGGRLKAVSGPDIDGCHRWLLKRADVERLRPDNRLTLPEAAKMMAISTATMLKWVQDGKVKPVSGPGIDRMGQYLFLKTAFTLQ